MRVLHLHSSFAAGGKELRAARLMNVFSARAAAAMEHVIVSAQPGAHGAKSALDPALHVNFPDDFPALQGQPTPARLLRIAQAMKGFDLVLTYNWGAMDAVLARRLFASALRLPPLVHHEDGFNEDEAAGLKPSRNLFRRLALSGASALVVPSRRLEAIALGPWKQPRRRVHLIVNGIPVSAYGPPPASCTIAGLPKQPGQKWVGTLAGLRAVKNLPRLVRAFASLPPEWHLVILGEGPEKAAIEAQAMKCGVADRVHLPGFVSDPSSAVGLFDLFALSSDSEQFPISVLEAMAAGLAIASPAVGDIAEMVSVENRSYITPPGDEEALAWAMAELAADPAGRVVVGNANRASAQAQYDEDAMIRAYAEVYGRAMGVARFP